MPSLTHGNDTSFICRLPIELSLRERVRGQEFHSIRAMADTMWSRDVQFRCRILEKHAPLIVYDIWKTPELVLCEDRRGAAEA